MSDPRVDYGDPIYGLRSELISIQSALNMVPEPLPGDFEAGAYLSDRDRWAKHAYEHVCAALRVLDNLARTVGPTVRQPGSYDEMILRVTRDVMTELEQAPDPDGATYPPLACLAARDRHVKRAYEIIEELRRLVAARQPAPAKVSPELNLIHVRFDLMPGERHFINPTGGEKFLARFDLAAVPAVGELVNIDGQPYRVLERGWAVGKDDGRMYAFVKVR